MLNKAEINLKNLIFNAKEIKKKLKDKTKLCVVVKADAYGHGAEMIASALYKYVDSFAVALVEEGIKLRYSGIDKEILVFTPPDNIKDIHVALRHNLSLTAVNLKQINEINRVAKKLAVSGGIHIKYDTGMARYGVKTLKELNEILKKLPSFRHVKLVGFYSHLAMPQNQKMLDMQVNKFLLAKSVVKGYNNKVTFHLSASGGFLRGKYFDMVRIGILLYGYKPFDSDEVVVKPIMKITAPVIEEKTIKKGNGALYGNKKAKKDTKCALVRFGYADGLCRRQTKHEFNNRCMDVSLVKESEKHTKSGEFVVLDNADEIAKRYGTISYEILTKATIRAEKIYKR